MRASVTLFLNLSMVLATVLKFHIHIPHEKNSCPLFSNVRVIPLFELCPFENEILNFVCKISQKVFKPEPPCLVY